MKPKKKQKEASLSLSLSSVPIHVQARRLKARFSWHMVRSERPASVGFVQIQPCLML